MNPNSVNPSECSVFSFPEVCDICPRNCGAQRKAGQRGVCGADDRLLVSRAALHHWEEPPISGTAGSGTIFFSYCSLRCLYCQNYVLAQEGLGKDITIERLADIMSELEAAGALNINCVTPTHYAPLIRRAISMARTSGMSLPVLWNTSGYETVDAIKANHGFVDAYLTDFKYVDQELARRYSHAPDYPERAVSAIDAMIEDVGEIRTASIQGEEALVSGVVVRHLLLPGALENSKRVVQLVHERWGNAVKLSLMNQYTPVVAREALQGNTTACRTLERAPELGDRVSPDEYEALLDYADMIGVDDYFWQEGEACNESFIPLFDFTGV